MKTDIPTIEPTPEPATALCRIAARLLGGFFSYGTYLIALLTWYLYDWFYAIAALLAGFVVLGILRAKIRNISIPLNQQEYTYTDQAIAKWFIVRRLLCDA
jgi:hypothetical protein